MSKLLTFLKAYVQDNYDDIRSEEHAVEVANGVEYYLSSILIPETIQQFDPFGGVVPDEENNEVATHGMYQERLVQHLTSLYGEASVASITFENHDDIAEYYYVRMTNQDIDSTELYRVCHCSSSYHLERIERRSSEQIWVFIGVLPHSEFDVKEYDVEVGWLVAETVRVIASSAEIAVRNVKSRPITTSGYVPNTVIVSGVREVRGVLENEG
ncbi:hypothetical protein POF51_29575 [Brevibacillus sp. AG]|uniref:hypothetical protein n=1 Tax=Brevibacillus sp. AG TaxID=3020891 RepID=UPI00232DE99E|nr:hypothetical protein [Brevibacillus sp. AG]MDC0764875.1 hypothetical protein [Brevibacillus sp. AG]